MRRENKECKEEIKDLQANAIKLERRIVVLDHLIDNLGGSESVDDVENVEEKLSQVEEVTGWMLRLS